MPRQTPPIQSDHAFMEALVRIAVSAGDLIMEHYGDSIQVVHKDDKSPVTAADQEAEALILSELKVIAPGVSVIAEEQAAAGNIPAIGDEFFLVDPLDGTREFINRNGEFTVNIALIRNQVPVCGTVVAPALGIAYFGHRGHGACAATLVDGNGASSFDLSAARPLSVRSANPEGLVAVASRSHRSDETQRFLDDHRVVDCISAGSSLKFCLVAEGKADMYPRLGRTMEWDTAAGHAVLSAAGGSVTQIDGSPFLYGKSGKGFANPHFIARGG